MSSSLDHKCQRCGSEYHGQVCPFCTITGLDVNALLATEGLTLPQSHDASSADPAEGAVRLIDVVSNRIFPINFPVCRFGRDISNDIVLTGDKSLSRFHFQVTSLNSDFFVEDSGSRNGTFLNGSPVTSPRKVIKGDIISAGMTRYRFVIGADDVISPPIEGDDMPANMPDDEDYDETPATATFAGSESNEQSDDDDDLFSSGTRVATPAAGGWTENTLHDIEDSSGTASPIPTAKPATSNARTSGTSNMDSDLDAFFAKVEGGNGAANRPSSTDKDKAGTAAKIPPEPVEKLLKEQLQAVSSAQETAPMSPPDISIFAPPVQTAAAAQDTRSGGTSSSNPQPESTTKHAEAILENTSVETGVSAAAKQIIFDQTAKTEAKVDNWPSWCLEVRIPELEHLREKMVYLESEIAERRQELETISTTVSKVESVKNHLLAGKQQDLTSAIINVFSILGWSVASHDNGDINEMILSTGNQTEAIVRVVCTESQPKPAELSKLVSSLSTYWCDHGVEPKGIILVSYLTDRPPAERHTLGQDFSDYATKKNVCVLTGAQLLGMYREVVLTEGDAAAIRATITTTSGILPGYQLIDESSREDRASRRAKAGR